MFWGDLRDQTSVMHAHFQCNKQKWHDYCVPAMLIQTIFPTAF